MYIAILTCTREPTVLRAQIVTLRDQLVVLKKGLQKSKDDCRAAFDSDGLKTEFVDDMIKNAESEPQKNPHLQRIHRYCQRIQQNANETRDAERRRKEFASERKHPER